MLGSMINYNDRPPLPPMTLAEYFAYDRSSQRRHEYVYGAVRAMAGGTLAHNAIATNTLVALHGRLGGPCRAYASDVQVRASSGLYYYPDVVVECGRTPDDSLVIERPVLIVEVASSATGPVDRGEKLIAYCGLESLRTYVILESRRKWATVMRRADGEWIRDEQTGGRIHISIPQGEIDIPFDEIYSGLDLPELVVREVPDSNSDAARRHPEPSPDL
jgi:Uma2 family endonuclease